MNEWIPSIPTEYGGTKFRSRLEAWWAATLDSYEMEWEYEPVRLELPSGATYTFDFLLRDRGTIIEVKGAHMQRVEKTRELAAMLPDFIILLGWSPAQCGEPGEPGWYMRWEDAGGYNALFGKCHCGAWQWFRPRFSLDCAMCEQRVGPATHLDNGHGTVPFQRSRDFTFALPSVKGTGS